MSSVEDQSLDRSLIREEIANSVTHGFGLVLAVAGLIALLFFAFRDGSAWHVASCAVFGIALVLLYAASTLYHSLRTPRLKHILKILDHCAIYLLIAGTYTPFTLIHMKGGWGYALCAVVWGLSLVGIVFKIFFIDSFKAASTLLYVLLGWSAVVAIKPLTEMLPSGAILWLLAGGLFYTVGVLFFVCKRIPYSHTIWHVFVMGGSVCHYLAVVFYVLPSRA
jgi:hemolysin III